MSHPPPYVFGRARQRFAAVALRDTLRELDTPIEREIPMALAFAVVIANGNQGFPRAYLRQIAGEPVWDAPGFRDRVWRCLFKGFPYPFEAIRDLEAYPAGSVDGDRTYMGNHRQKALGRCVHEGLQAARREGARFPDEQAVVEAYALRLDDLNGDEARVFRRHANLPGAEPWREAVAVLLGPDDPAPWT